MNENKIYEKYIVIRKPSLQEDEGRYRTLGFFDSKKECEDFILDYLQDYWMPEEFIIASPMDQPNRCN